MSQVIERLWYTANLLHRIITMPIYTQKTSNYSLGDFAIDSEEVVFGSHDSTRAAFLSYYLNN